MCLFERVNFWCSIFISLISPYNFYFKVLNGRFNTIYCEIFFVILFP